MTASFGFCADRARRRNTDHRCRSTNGHSTDDSRASRGTSSCHSGETNTLFVSDELTYAVESPRVDVVLDGGGQL